MELYIRRLRRRSLDVFYESVVSHSRHSTTSKSNRLTRSGVIVNPQILLSEASTFSQLIFCVLGIAAPGEL